HPGHRLPPKASLAFDPLSFEDLHGLLHCPTRERKGQPIDGEGEWGTHRTDGPPVTMCVASAPVLPTGGVSLCARPALAARRARRSPPQADDGIPFHL